MMKKNLFIEIFYYCFPLVLLCQLLIVFGVVPSNYPLTLLNAEYIIVGGISFFTIKYFGEIRTVMTIFIVYTALSGLVYSYNGMPFSIYIDSLRNYILPMLMFFIGMNSKFSTEKFIKPFAYTMVFVLIITAYGYITFAPWYIDYRTSILSASEDEAYALKFMRFSGPYGGSYYIQYLCVGLLDYYLDKIIIKGNGRFEYYIVVIVMVISLILCQQRTSMLFAGLSIPYFLLFKKGSVKYLFYFILVIVSISVIVTYINFDRADDIIDLLTRRAESMSFNEAFGEREDKVFRVFPVWKNYIFGDGVGVYSHAAHYAGYISVNDCAWIKLLVEQGVVGVMIFLYIVLTSVIKALKQMSNYYPELFVIMFYMVAMIGSDSLSMVVEMSVFFWFALGRIWCKHSNNYAIERNL